MFLTQLLDICVSESWQQDLPSDLHNVAVQDDQCNTGASILVHTFSNLGNNTTDHIIGAQVLLLSAIEPKFEPDEVSL